jgi:Protein of unknown function (DUF1552)
VSKPTSKSFSRRLLLRGAGGAALALPWLPSLLPKTAAAAAAKPPKRLIVMKSFSTQLIRKWYPAFTGNGYVLKDTKYKDSKADGTTLLSQKLVSGQPYTWAPLADLRTDRGISGILGPKLNPLLDKLTLIRGLDFLPSVNHNFGGLLGNFSSCTKATPCDADTLADAPTIDQVLAYSPKFYEAPPAVRALSVSQGVVDAMSYSDGGKAGGAVEQLKARTNPRDVFNDLFASLGNAPTAEPEPDPDRLLVDKVIEQYRSLKQNPRLSSDDRNKLEQHIGLLSEVEAKLSTTPQLSCTKPADPGSLDNNSGTDPSDILKKWDLFLELVSLGISCDRTRIVTLAVHKALGPGPDPSDPKLVGHYHSEDASGGTWHGLAHDFANENSRRMLAGINNWIAEELFAKLVTKLDVPEADGSTFLDNSLVYWGNELGFNHIGYSVPCLLAGTAGGFIKPGRYLDYIDWDGRAYFSQEDGNVIKGIPHNRLLVTVLQAMGLAPSDYERAGQPGYGSTNTSGRDPSLWPVDYDLSAIGQVLPGIGA